MKMFGFSRRRMKLGRLKKVQLNDTASQGNRSPVIQTKRNGSSNSESSAGQSSGSQSNVADAQCTSAAAPESDSSPAASGSENWMLLSISGDKPAPRSNHAAAVIGNKMIVVGGESGNGLLDDVQVLNFDRFNWTTASSKLYLSPTSLPLKIPACKGHSLVSWGKKVLLVGGKTEPWSDKISVWAFDTESECWSLMESKGDVPVARSGHSVVRASSVLILFGGEDAKRRKLNDLHMFDLKSLTWLPLHFTGTGPSARANHTAALYDDKTLYVFGGASKSRTLNDLYSLDFETMIWSRIKIRGFHPSPRAGCCGVLCGTKWYIVGGGSKKKRRGETLVFDILKVEWSVAVSSTPSSITTNKGFSLVYVQHKEKDFLVAFGGSKKEPSEQVEVLAMEKSESLPSRRSIPAKGPGSLLLEKYSSSNGSSQRTVDSAARQNPASTIEQHGSGRLSLSESSLSDPNPGTTGNISLRKQFHNEEEYNMAHKTTKHDEETSLSHGTEQKTSQSDTDPPHEPENSNPHNHHHHHHQSQGGDSGPSSISQFYESKITSLIRRNAMLEGQLAASLAGRDAAEKSLSSALKGKSEAERKLGEAVKGVEMMKEKLAAVEMAHEEANNLSNIVHSDNVRLEHDVAFLKAVLDDTQKELHSTRGVLAGERARAFQLQVEVFHLKQRLQSLENRAPTPRKPF